MEYFPYKNQYTYQDIINTFYPELFRIIVDRYPERDELYTDQRYLTLINMTLENPLYAARFLYLIFGYPDNIFGPNIFDKDAIAKLEFFAMTNNLNIEKFESWYRQGSHDIDTFLAVKRFLIDGSLTVELDIGYLNDKLSEILERFKNKSHVFLLDADNLYRHIGPLFRLVDPDLYSISFFKKNNISPYYTGFRALYYRTTNGINSTTIEAYGARKDAADVEITTAMAILKVEEVLHSISVGKYYVVTGDEYAHELVETSNNFFRTRDHVIRLNSQLIDFNKTWSRLQPWAIDPKDFPMHIYGELTDYNIDVKIRPIVSPFDGRDNNLNNLLVSVNPSTNTPICTMWMIYFIKNNPEISTPVMEDYTEIFNILRRIDISSYQEFKDYIFSNVTVDKWIELRQQFLVLMGAKYFTMKELRQYFLPQQFSYLKSLKDKIKNDTLPFYTYNRNGRSITLTDKTLINEFLALPISNRDIFNIFFKITFQTEAYLYHIDILIALSIYNVSASVIDLLKPENTIINSISFII